jgi:F-type H+-transporting ATPase subunit gamma
MLTLEWLKRKLHNSEEVKSAIKNMKADAEGALLHYELAIDSLREHNAELERELHVLLSAHPEKEISLKGSTTGKWGVIIYGSDMGMVGQFNAQIVSFAMKKMRDLQVKNEDRIIFLLGERLQCLVEQEEQNIEKHFSFPETLEGVAGIIEEIVDRIEVWRMEENVEQIALFHNKPGNEAPYIPEMQNLLEIDPDWIEKLRYGKFPPYIVQTYLMDWDSILSVFIRHYFFVILYQAFVESLASENAIRRSSIQTTEKYIQDILEESNVQ